MSGSFPVEERIYVLKNEESLGPFGVEEILELIESGTLDYDDICLREGDIETDRLRNLLDWDRPEPSATESPTGGEDGEPGYPDEPEDFPGFEPDPAKPAFPPSEVLYRGSRSILSFPLSFLGLVGGIVGAIWLYPLDARFMFASVAVTLLALVHLSLMKFTCEYFITPRRIEVERGLIAKSSNEIRIVDVRAINVTCRGWIGLLGVGTVDFFTSGDDPEVTFESIWAAKKIKSLVRRIQDAG